MMQRYHKHFEIASIDAAVRMLGQAVSFDTPVLCIAHDASEMLLSKSHLSQKLSLC
ncbi:hypothetical protein TX09_002294 [Salmonella enterica subsp. arizonae]|nr:hypothetical protein [Salmonella enterica subsp. arizonae]